MPRIGYHASHEQHSPSRLLTYVQAAERAGFTGAMCSDHYHPWSERQGESGFAWSWLGAALQATSLPFGIVNAPGQRYNPAVVAQAAATLAVMFPDRFWIAVGSGENLNEHITGERWPAKPERNERLLEAVQVMRALWRGETVTHHGHFQVEEARLYTLPPAAPMLLGAAITKETARWVGSWADGLITVTKPREQLEEIVHAFRDGGGEKRPMFLQVQLAYAPTDGEAEEAAFDQWRTNIFSSSVLSTLRMPAEFDAAARFIQPGALHGPVRISSDLERHIEWIRKDFDLGFTELYLHNLHRDYQETFIDHFGERVLPEVLSEAAGG